MSEANEMKTEVWFDPMYDRLSVVMFCRNFIKIETRDEQGCYFTVKFPYDEWRPQSFLINLGEL